MISLTEAQKQTLQQLSNAGDYPGAYSFLQSVAQDYLMNQAVSADEQANAAWTASWLESAAHINAGDGSIWSNYVRQATYDAGADLGIPIDPTTFQDASDALAQNIINNVLLTGAIPLPNQIIQADMQSSIENLNIPSWAWVGTLGAPLFFNADTWGAFQTWEQFKYSVKLNWNTFCNNVGDFLDSVQNVLNEAAIGVLDTLFDFISTPAHAADIDPAARFDPAQRWVMPRRDPLTFDLDGDGIETVPTSAGVLFDHDGDGLKQGTGWIGADDGFLVLDRNGNSTIDNGIELFGDSTALYTGGTAADGFAALAQEDTNADGVVSGLDARWNELRMWRDLNQNGESEAGELFTLDELGIASINVASTTHNQTLANGNQIADLGTYTRTDGSTGTVAETSDLADVNLATDTFQREFTDQVPLAEGVAALPNMQGSGLVRDLREAMSQSPTLQGLVQQFAAATTKAEQMAILDSLLDAWADTSGLADSLDDRTSAYKIRYMAFGAVTRVSHVSAAEGGGTLDTDATSVELADDLENLRLDAEYKTLIETWNTKIHMLEAFNGRYFFTLPGETQSGISAVTGETTQSTGKYYDAATGVKTLMISYSQAQLDLMQQSYDALCGCRCAAANDATWRACA